LAPLLHETYPVDFDFGLSSLTYTETWSEAEKQSLFTRMFQQIDARIASMEFAQQYRIFFTKLVVLMFLDEIDQVTNCQISAAVQCAGLKSGMEAFDMADSTRLTQAQGRVTDGGAGIFRTVQSTSPPSVNLDRVLCAMRLMGSLKEYECKKAMARSRNPAIFALMAFAKTWMTDEKLIALLFTTDEWKMLWKFVFTAKKFKVALGG
jgi:hypothetical protein